jgi:hypothetical protein
VTSEKIEDVLAMMNEMGINVVETEEADNEDVEESEEEESEGGDLVEVAPKTPAKSETREPAERTDDPVRMYLREMGSVELLSREGEIAIAKRIEAGREAMIAGLCESPLSFQAIIIWRDELNEGKVFLRDIIDLEATYAGPDAKQAAPAVGVGEAVPGGNGGTPTPLQSVSPPSAPPAATPFKPAVAGRRRRGRRRRGPNSGIRSRRGRSRKFDVARRDRGRAQAEGARDVRHHRQRVQAAAPPARAGHPQQTALDRFAHPEPGAQIQEAQGRDHPAGQVVAA